MKNKGFLALLRAQFLGFWGINKFLNKKGRKKSSAFTAVGFAAIGILLEAVIVLYVYIYASLFGELGVGKQFIYFVTFILNVLVLFFAVSSTLGSLFGFKDYEMVMSLPIKTWQIIVAKLLYIYLSNFLLCIAVVIPSLIIILLYEVLGAGLIISTLLTSVFLPLLPISIAVFLGTVIAYFSSKFKHKNLVQLFAFILFFLICYAIGFVSGLMEEDTESLNIFGNMAVIKFFDYVLNNWLFLCLYIVGSLAIFSLPCLFLAKNFKKINSALLTHKTKSVRVKIEGKTRNKFSALFSRERKRLFACPAYALNCLIGPIMSIIVSITFIVLVNELNQVGGLFEMNVILAFILLAVLGLLLTIAPTTSSSISLDAKNLWELKSLPVTTNQILFSKLLLNTLVNVPLSFVISVVFAIILKLNFGFALLFVLCSMLIPFFGGVVGLFLNVLVPYLTWENETAAVKRGASSFLVMLVDMATIALVGVAVYLLLQVNIVNEVILLLAVTLIFAVLTLVFLYLLVTVGVKRFNKIA